jgi:hypothetical protein
MTQCKFCGGDIKRQDAVAVDRAGTIGSAMAPLLVSIEIAAADVGRDDPDVQEIERLARNGAGMARSLHDPPTATRSWRPSSRRSSRGGSRRRLR